MNRGLSPASAEAFVAVARRVLYGISTGEITAPAETQKKLRDLETKAKQALEQAKQRREIR